MKVQRLLAIACVALTSVTSYAAETVHLYLKSSRAAAFNGPAKVGGQAGWFEGELISGIISPRDQASGLPTGKRTHKPIVVKMPASQTSGQFYQALCTNENIKELTIELKDASGKTKRGKLIGPKIQKVTISAVDSLPFEEISFTYLKIEWESN